MVVTENESVLNRRRYREAGMSAKSPAAKGGIKPGTSVAILNGVPEIVAALGLPSDVRFVGPIDAQVVFLFVNTRAELDRHMPSAVTPLAPHAVIWVCFRKGSRAAGLDMSRNDVWAVAERLGMRPLGLIAIDETWSAFRLRRHVGTG